FGSLDNPEKIKCFHPDTDILSINGWKNIKEITVGEKVLSINPINGETCYNPVTNIFVYDYNGKMFTTYRNNRTRPITRFCVTPEHKMLLQYSEVLGRTIKNKKQNVMHFEKISDIALKKKGTKSVPRIFNYNYGEFIDFYDIPKYKSDYYKENGKCLTRFPIISWLKFLGWYLSEGNFSVKYGKKYYAYISQSSIVGRKKIEDDLKDFPVHYVKDKSGYKFNSKDLAIYVSQFGKCDDKFIPRDILNLHPSLLKHLFDCLISGDGHIKKNGSIRYTTTSLKLAKDIVELGVKLQYSASFYFSHKTKTGKNCYNVFFNKTKFSSIQNLTEFDYKGKVYCIETAPFHTIVSMYDGCPIGIGQSSG
ncbi:MAG: LAGLIDADG family homing endonuclease, partial [Patescibacteria group bacterium]